MQSKDSDRLATEAKTLRGELLEQTHLTRTTLAYLGPEFRGDPAFVTALDAIEVTLPSQLQDTTDLAAAGDWEAARLHLDNELGRIEGTASAHVKSIDQDLDEELPRAVANMKDVQRRLVLIVPATAISTVFIAALFGWAVARRMLELRVEERVNERMRIARDLHDTLLQSFQGVLLKFHTVEYLIPDRPSEARKILVSACDRARQAIVEGRNAIHGLRASAVATNDLASAISAIGEELAADQNSPAFRVQVEGESRDLAPLVRDEVYRIGCEALRNAFRHANARHIEVELCDDQRHFLLRVRDDGKGIDSKVLDEGGREKNNGLPGMQERAKLTGGKLSIRSRPGSGTEIQLAIPAAIAYAKSPAERQRESAGEGTGRHGATQS